MNILYFIKKVKNFQKSIDKMPLNVYNYKGPLMRTSDKSTALCGCSSMVESQPSKLIVWVRFPSPAPLTFMLVPSPYRGWLYAPVAQSDRATAF